jgi:hypothetical protein
MKEGFRQKRLVLEAMKLKKSILSKEKLEATKTMSSDDEGLLEPDPEINIKKKREMTAYLKAREIAYLKLQEKTQGRRIKN